jgi:hypothetical protein
VLILDSFDCATKPDSRIGHGMLIPEYQWILIFRLKNPYNTAKVALNLSFLHMMCWMYFLPTFYDYIINIWILLQHLKEKHLAFCTVE